MSDLRSISEQKTRQSVFLEQWPNAETRSNGVLDIKPCSVEKYVVCCKCCTECYQNFWLQEVKFNDDQCFYCKTAF